MRPVTNSAKIFKIQLRTKSGLVTVSFSVQLVFFFFLFGPPGKQTAQNERGNPDLSTRGVWSQSLNRFRRRQQGLWAVARQFEF